MSEIKKTVDADSDDEVPGLDDAPELAEVGGEDGGDEEVAAGGDDKSAAKQNRNEKKSRKALQKLGMKSVPDIIRVTVKKSKNILFVISRPDVFKVRHGANPHALRCAPASREAAAPLAASSPHTLTPRSASPPTRTPT